MDDRGSVWRHFLSESPVLSGADSSGGVRSYAFFCFAGVDADAQRLCYGLHPLEDDETLAELGLEEVRPSRLT